MKEVSTFLNLIRIKHWIKNLIIFLPLFFGKELINSRLLIATIIVFLAFSLVTSAVYTFNDIKDYEMDKKNSIKKTRPIASGRIWMEYGKTMLSRPCIRKISQLSS